MSPFVAESGLYWAYALTDKEILKLKTVSRGAFTAIYAILLIVPTILLGPIGGLGFVIAYALVYFPFRARASSVRRQLSTMSEDEISRSDRVVDRIRYDQITEGELKSDSYPTLKLRYDHKKAKMKFGNTSFKTLEVFLSSRTGTRITKKVPVYG